jgi:hypothetical protein
MAGGDLARALVYVGREAELSDRLDRSSAKDIHMRLTQGRFAMWRGETFDLQPTTEEHGMVRDVPRYVEFAEHVYRTRAFRPGDLELLTPGIMVANPRLRATRCQFMAEFLLFIGDVDKAISFIRDSVDAGLQDHCWLERCPMFAPLYGRADFEELRSIVAERARQVLGAVGEVLSLPS